LLAFLKIHRISTDFTGLTEL